MDTHGWDTVFVVDENRLNELLRANADKVVLDFDTHLPDQPEAAIKGRFAPWQIAQGGSNEIIHLKLPIESGTLTDGEQTFDLAGMTLVIATYLEWLNLGTEQQSLVFDYEKLGEPENPPQRGELAVIRLQDPNGILAPRYHAWMQFALGDYLVAHAGEVRFVFATVNLVAPSNTPTWLTPVKTTYAYLRREDSGVGNLAIFSVTTDRDISNLQPTVDPAILPDSTNASYLISRELFLKNVVASGLARSFQTDLSAFVYDSGTGALRNTRKLGTKGVKVGAITYHPEITSLEVKSGQDRLTGHYEGKADMKAGIYLYYTIDSANAATYSEEPGALSFQKDPSPKESHRAKIPWWFFAAGPIVIAIVEIVVAIIGNNLASDISDDSREHLAFGQYPPSAILLGDSNAISVTFMGVNGSLYVYGNV